MAADEPSSADEAWRRMGLPAAAQVSAKAPAAFTRKAFYVAGVVDPDKHYVIDRSDWHRVLADKLAGGAHVLLHAHRQGGKSSAARVVGSLLEQREGDGSGFRVLKCTVESTRPSNASAMWNALAQKLRRAILAAPHGWAPPRLSALIAAGTALFVDAASFEAFFGVDVWGDLRVILIIDELDTLLEAPATVRQELLSSLRALRTENVLAPALHGSPVALHAVLGIGVYRLLQLSSGEGPLSTHSPFDVSDTLTVPRTTLEQVHRMLEEFARDSGSAVPELIAQDMLWRSGGHVGLLSLLGQQLARLCDSLKPGDPVDEASWAAEVSGSALVSELRASATVSSLLRSVFRHVTTPLVRTARRIVRSMLSAPDNMFLDVEGGRDAPREALAYLLAEGVVVEHVQDGARRHRIVAPMIVPLLMMDIGSAALPAQLPRLPFPRRPDDSVHLQQTVLEALPFLDLDAVFHSFAQLKSGQPCEYAYHFQLFDILSRRSGEDGWRVLGETRNAAAPGPLRRLDLLIASNGQRCGIDLLVDGQHLDKHVYEQAGTYCEQQRLSSVIVVNFASSRRGIVERLREALPPGVEVLQVLVNRVDLTVTPFTLADDGLTATALAPVALLRRVAAMVGEHASEAPLRARVATLAVGAPASAAAPAPTHAVLEGVAYGLEAGGSVRDMLAAAAADLGEPPASLTMWLTGAGEDERVSNAQRASALTALSRAEGMRLEVRRSEDKPPLTLTLR